MTSAHRRLKLGRRAAFSPVRLGFAVVAVFTAWCVSLSAVSAAPLKHGPGGSGPRLYGYAAGPAEHLGTAAGRAHLVPASATRAKRLPAGTKGHHAPKPDLAPAPVGHRNWVRTGRPRMAPGHEVADHRVIRRGGKAKAKAAGRGGKAKAKADAADSSGTDNASYSVGSTFDTVPMADQNGRISVVLTNTGTTTWGSGYGLGTQVFPASDTTGTGTPLTSGVSVAVSGSVAPGANATVESVTPAENPGSYTICWDMVNASGTYFSAEGGAEYCAPYTIASYAPVINEQEPLPGTDVDSQTPMLSASATVPGGYPANPTFSYAFEILNGPTSSATVVASSGWVTGNGNSWTPTTNLTWGGTYYWQVTVSDAATPPSLTGSGITWTTPISFVVGNAQPGVSSRLGNAYQADDGNPIMTSDLGGGDYSGSGKTVDPQSGNISEQVTDASVASVGPALSIVRTYNSLDPRTSQAFGTGWSSVLDMSLAPDPDGSGALILTLASGQQVRFAKNSAGGYAPPPDMYAVVTALSGGGYSVTDQTGTTYNFAKASGSSWLISQFTDNTGMAQTFTYSGSTLTTITNATSGRSLHLTWSTPTGASFAHVATVATDPVTTGQSSSALTWTYGYHGDVLTSVCPPGTTTQCTTYSYITNGSHAPTSVLNANPTSYYRLDDPTGSTAAANEVPVNDLTTMNPPATEMNTTLGVAGPVPGTTATGFNGTSSWIPLDGAWCPTAGQGSSCKLITATNRVLSSTSASPSLAISIWFKTTSTSGVLAGVTSSLPGGPNSCGLTCISSTAVPLLWIASNGHLDGVASTFTQLGSGGSVYPLTSMTTSAAVNNGAWHQAVLIPGQAMYLDGALVATAKGSVTLPSNSYAVLGAGLVMNPQCPGCIGYPPSWVYFNGSMADLSVYSEQLPSSGTVAAQYAAETTPAAELTTVTSPGGRTELSATYDTVNDRVASLVDGNGGNWKYSGPVTGSTSTVYDSSVMGSAAEDFWPLSDTSGPLAQDAIASAANTARPRPPATYSNVTLGVPGPAGDLDGTAASFGGSNSQLAIPGGYFGRTGAESAELWFSTTLKSKTLLSASGGTGGSAPTLWINSSGCLEGQIAGAQTVTLTASSCTSTNEVNNGKWHQAVLTLSPGTTSSSGAFSQTATLYQDGLQVATAQLTKQATASATGYTATIGNGPDGDFSGSIADVSLYTTGLTSNQVVGHYSSLQNQIAVVDASQFPAGVSAPSLNTDAITVTNPLGSTMKYVYSDGALIRTVNPLGGATSYGYDAALRAATITDPDGDTTYMAFDAHNNVTSSTTCAAISNCQTSYASYFEDLANPLDPRDDKVTASRDPRSTSPTDPTYDTVTTYTAVGQIASLTTPPTAACPSGCGTTNTYTTGKESAVGGGTEPAALLASVTTPDGGVTKYAYDSSGDVMTVTNPLGLVTSYTYDNLGRELTQTQVSNTYPAGLTTSFTYDSQDRVLTQTAPPVTDRVTGAVHTKVISYTYDADSDVLTTKLSDSTGGDPARTTTDTYTSHAQIATVSDPLGHITSYTYNGIGDLASVTDPVGVTTSYTYDADDDLLTTTLDGYTGNPSDPITAENLVGESRAYDPGGRLASVTDSVGTTTDYTYYDNNELASSYIVGPGGTGATNVTSYSYDAAGNQVAEIDPNGLVTDGTYNPDNQAVALTEDPSGVDRTLTAGYDPDGNLVTDTTSQGGTTSKVTATYNAMDEELSQTVADGSTNLTTTFVRDQRGLVTAQTDPAGNTTYAQNDEDGRTVAVTAPAVPVENSSGTTVMANPVTEAGYDTFGDETEYSDADGNVTTAAYDPDGQQTSSTDPSYTPPGASAPVNGTITISYNSLGQVAKQTDPLGNATSFSYDQLGDLAGQTDPDGGGWIFTYDPAGRQTSVTDPMGGRTEATYDDLGNLSTSTDLVRQNAPAADTTGYSYDAAGNLTSQTSPTGVTTTATFNPLGQPTSTTDGAGNTTTYSYDVNDDLTKVTEPDGTASTANYDQAGRTTSTSDLSASGAVLSTSSVGYDADGDITALTDFLGNTTSYSYDATGMLLSQTQPVSAGHTIKVSYGYDLDGNQTTFTGGNGNTSYTTYNALGLPQTSVEPSTAQHSSAADSTTTDSYDADGNLIAQVQPGGVQLASTYNSMGALTSESGSGATAPTATRTFSYDTDGQLLTASTSAAGTAGSAGYQPTTSESFSYDDRGLLLSSSGTTGNTSFTYNASAQVTSDTDAAGTTSYTYDPAGRLASLADPATGTLLSYQYDDMDRLTQIGYGSGGDTRRFGYNNFGELTSDTLASPSGSTAASIAYGYDANGDLTSKTTTGFAGAAANSYTYDEAGRLTSWNNGTTTTGYAYDADSNLTQAGNYSYAFDARDEETSVSCPSCATTTLSYTADGDLAQSSGPNGTYNQTSDAYGQQVTQQQQAETYDALGRLITDRGFTGNHTLSYNGASDLIASDGNNTYSYDLAGNLTGIGVAGGTASQGSLAYTDAHTDVVGAFTAAGSSLSASVAYDPWGDLIATSGTPIPGSLGYQSDYSGSGDGLVDMGSRWYWPAGHTFVSKDSQSNSAVPDSAQANPFAYAGDNPLDETDPSGHGPSSSGGGGSGPVTKADLDAAAAAVQKAEATATAAKAAANNAWSAYDDARQAASQAAALARELNAKASSLKSQYDQAEAAARAAFLQAGNADQSLGQALEQQSEDEAQLSEISHETSAQAGPATSSSGGGGGGAGCSGSVYVSTDDGVLFRVPTDCHASEGGGTTISGGPNTNYYFLGQAEQELKSDLQRLSTAIRALRQEVSQDNKLASEDESKAKKLDKAYTAARVAAANAEGKAAAAQRYANQDFNAAQRLTQVYDNDETALKKAEDHYQTLEKEYQAEQKADQQKGKKGKGKGKGKGGGSGSGAGGGGGPPPPPPPPDPPEGPPDGGKKPPKGPDSTVVGNGDDANGCPADSGSGDGTSLVLRYKPGWTPEQIAQANEKVAALSEAAGRGELQVTKPVRSAGSAAARLRRAGVHVPDGYHGDHIIDLQLGGSDSLDNIRPLDPSVNTSLGPQIAGQLRGDPVGTPVTAVAIC